MYTATKGLKSEYGTVVSDNCTLRAASAVASAAVLPAIPMSLGTQTKLIFRPELKEFVKMLNDSQYNGILHVSVFNGFQA
jgi:hypothetical protein